jgi:hypothetical protein
MTRFITRPATWIWTAAAALALLGAPSLVRADHDSFAYAGPTYGFHGEAPIIESLNSIEHAYTARRPWHAQRFVRDALASVRVAYGTLCVPSARYYVHGAEEHLEAFLFGRRLVDLDDAARLLNKALVVEQTRHRHAHLAPRRSHFRRGYGGYPHRNRYWGGSGLYLGGRRGGLVIRF